MIYGEFQKHFTCKCGFPGWWLWRSVVVVRLLVFKYMEHGWVEIEQLKCNRAYCSYWNSAVFLNRHFLNRCKPFVNFHNPERVDVTIFAGISLSFLGECFWKISSAIPIVTTIFYMPFQIRISPDVLNVTSFINVAVSLVSLSWNWLLSTSSFYGYHPHAFIEDGHGSVLACWRKCITFQGLSILFFYYKVLEVE